MDGGQNVAGRALHRFTVRDYYAMGDAGVFANAPRVELIEGVVVDMAPIGTPHAWAVNALVTLFSSLAVAGRASISVQNPVRLDDESEPQPDVALLAAGTDRASHPAPKDVLLLVEVADTTLEHDRRVKGPLYARSGVREYWIVNVADKVIEVHRGPGPGGYERTLAVRTGGIAIEAMPDVVIAPEQVFS